MQTAIPTIYIDPGVTDAVDGTVVWSPIKSAWIGCVFAVAIVGGALTYSTEALIVFMVTTAITICLGHSLGMHRRFIHKSYECPQWLEYFFVHLGVIVGLAGPIGMLQTHDTRDWAQRQPDCHPYFAHQSSFLKDGVWQLLCEVQLTNPPQFIPELAVTADPVYAFMQRTWILQQLPLLVVLWLLGGASWVIWGGAVRVAVSVTGHWFIGYFAHNTGRRDWHVAGACVQGYNIPFCGLLTMGECWHNNHHAFPGSAKLGLKWNQCDPGWWALCALKKSGLVWNLKLPSDLPDRENLFRFR